MIGMGIACLAGAAITAWLMWGPVLQFFFSFIPANAEYAWVAKIIVVGLVAYFGGIGLPIALLIFAGVCFFSNAMKN